VGFEWKPKYVTFGLVEAFEIVEQALAKKLIALLDEYA